jgi:hypothetical protein
MAKRVNLPEHSVAIVFSFGNNNNIVGSIATNIDDSNDDGRLAALGTGIMSEVFKPGNMAEFVEAGLQHLRKNNPDLDKALTERDNMRSILSDVQGNA